MAFSIIRNSSTSRLVEYAVTAPPAGAKRGGTRWGLNGGVGAEVVKNDAKAFLISYDPDTYRIALRMTDESDPNAFPLIFPGPARTNRTTSISFMGWALVQQIGWVSPTRISIALNYDETTKTFVGALPREWVTNTPLKRKRSKKN